MSGSTSRTSAQPVKHRRIGQYRMLAVILLVLGLLFLLGNIMHLATNDPDERSGQFSTPLWNGDRDGSYIEMFGHTQLLGGVIMLIFLTGATRSFSYVAWAAVLLTLVADDFLMIHERWGARLVQDHGLPAVGGLRPQDLGELLVWVCLAVVLGVLLVVTYVIASRSDRRNSLVLLGWIGVLAVFAVVVDLLHIVVEPHVPHTVTLALTLTETAGELIGMSLIVLAVHRMTLALPVQDSVERPVETASR